MTYTLSMKMAVELEMWASRERDCSSEEIFSTPISASVVYLVDREQLRGDAIPPEDGNQELAASRD
jgi:hypothetical protein